MQLSTIIALSVATLASASPTPQDFPDNPIVGAPGITCYDSGKVLAHESANDAVKKFCKGDDPDDGSGGFATGQTKYGCYNTGIDLAELKNEFWIQNRRGSGSHLSEDECREYFSRIINTCWLYGGRADIDVWYLR
jgi:hypothetical protein